MLCATFSLSLAVLMSSFCKSRFFVSVAGEGDGFASGKIGEDATCVDGLSGVAVSHGAVAAHADGFASGRIVDDIACVDDFPGVAVLPGSVATIASVRLGMGK